MPVEEGVVEEAVSGGEGEVEAAGDGAVGEDELPEEGEVVGADGVADVEGPPADGAGGGVEGGAEVVGLEHVPVGAEDLAHPQAVVGAVHHMHSLQPEDAQRVPVRILEPEVVSCAP